MQYHILDPSSSLALARKKLAKYLTNVSKVLTLPCSLYISNIFNIFINLDYPCVRFTNDFYISTNKPIRVVPHSSLQAGFADFSEPPLPMLSKGNPIKAKVNLSLACHFLSEHFQRSLVSVLNSHLSFFLFLRNRNTTIFFNFCPI